MAFSLGLPLVGQAARLMLPINGMSRSTESERLLPMKKPTQHFIAEVPRSSSRVGITQEPYIPFYRVAA